MSGKHFSDDELVSRLFGLETEDGHLGECVDCRQRLERMARRHQLCRSSEPEIPGEFLAAQRREVYGRIERKPRKPGIAWIPLPIGALVIVLLMFTVFKPAPQRQTADALSDDAALQDVFNVASRMDPSSLQPVQSLFEEQK
jgi:hypothetical protein